nr:MAG TPA: restriction alleviation protein [Caudoviricetes sp.]
MDEIKLKPCPFCGGIKIFVGSVAEIEYMDETNENYVLDSGVFQVVCDYNSGGCGASSGCCLSKDVAIAAWNRRADNG